METPKRSARSLKNEQVVDVSPIKGGTRKNNTELQAPGRRWVSSTKTRNEVDSPSGLSSATKEQIKKMIFDAVALAIATSSSRTGAGLALSAAPGQGRIPRISDK